MQLIFIDGNKDGTLKRSHFKWIDISSTGSGIYLILVSCLYSIL